MLSDEQWAELEPLIEACRPHAKVPSPLFRRTVEAILWRHQNGAKWRSLPPEFGPWWMAAQTFIRWARLGVRGGALGPGSGTWRQARHGVPGRDQHPGSPEGRRRQSKGESVKERDGREALGRSRGGYGTKAFRNGRRRRGCHRLPPFARTGSRTTSDRCAPRPHARRAQLGRGRPRLHQPCLPSAHLGHGSPTSHLTSATRGAGRLSALDLQQPQPGRTRMGSAERVARCGHPLREKPLSDSSAFSATPPLSIGLSANRP